MNWVIIKTIVENGQNARTCNIKRSMKYYKKSMKYVFTFLEPENTFGFVKKHFLVKFHKSFVNFLI